MPTITEYFGIGFTNNGPLTTTYTPPASCTTVTTDQILFAQPDSITVSYGVPTCESASMGKCIPSGSNHDKVVSYYNAHGGQGTIDYYSPGIACPKGWTTAGTLAHGNKTGSVNKRGVFTQTRDVSIIDPNMPLEQVWLNALGPSETLAYCCPSGWVAAKAGGCFSSIKPLRSATYTEVCRKYLPRSAIRSVYTVEGSKVSEYLHSVVPAEPTSTIWPMTVLQTLGTFKYDELAVVRRFPAVKLVYKESDLKLAGDGDESNGGENSGDDDAEDEDDDNGASSLLISGGLFSILAVLFSMLIGAGLVML
ncbi:uncharacterized protein FTJAE_4099 [Fusarium tjaetaba]|uniref:Uncharacterized protein n=1 Tax=Fusarium tjaetaba TaxID=1567544 RepID=A0A8H5VXR0_9HYPO|nr:uncharacterized protein FTJAE_4099 [Fusarium tjaetaba]KAF5641447.1 hypothetical protein FTJAE_4099 [Fusarium tjaetaba]